MLLIQSHLRASDLFVRQDREGKESRESQGKSYLPWAFLEAIFLASTPNIHLHLAFDIKACLFTHRSPLIPLFSCITLGSEPGGLASIRSSSEAGNRSMDSPGKAPSSLVYGLALSGGLLKSMAWMGRKPPFGAQCTGPWGSPHQAGGQRRGGCVLSCPPRPSRKSGS